MSKLIFNKIKIARKTLKLSQQVFADKIKLTQKDISKLESGSRKTIPNTCIIFLLEQGFDLNTLFDDNKDLEFLNTTKDLDKFEDLERKVEELLIFKNKFKQL